jgi:hypothetical protein
MGTGIDTANDNLQNAEQANTQSWGAQPAVRAPVIAPTQVPVGPR